MAKPLFTTLAPHLWLKFTFNLFMLLHEVEFSVCYLTYNRVKPSTMCSSMTTTQLYFDLAWQ